MERHLRGSNPGSPFLIRLGDNLYLSPEFVVHHRDRDMANNAIANLECMTTAEHVRHHTEPNGTVLRCEGCGKSFRVPHHRAETARFCSKKCQGKSKRKTSP